MIPVQAVTLSPSHADMSTVNTMFKWVQGSADKMERIGLEVIDGLNSVISQAQVSQETGCSICGAGILCQLVNNLLHPSLPPSLP